MIIIDWFLLRGENLTTISDQEYEPCYLEIEEYYKTKPNEERKKKKEKKVIIIDL